MFSYHSIFTLGLYCRHLYCRNLYCRYNYVITGVGVAHVFTVPVLLVEIAAAGVRIPVVPATKIDIEVTPPPHRRWPNSPNRTRVEDQLNDS